MLYLHKLFQFLKALFFGKGRSGLVPVDGGDGEQVGI